MTFFIGLTSYRFKCRRFVNVSKTCRCFSNILITAFRATLEEMEGSDLLIHLVDASNPQFENHITSVNKILDDLNLSQIPRLLVFNKADLLNEEELINLRRAFNAVTVSAMNRATLAPAVRAQTPQATIASRPANRDDRDAPLSSGRDG